MEEGSEAPIDSFGAPRDRLRAALDASCVVGTWEWDIVGGTIVYDTGAAELLTGDAALADTRISSLQAVAAVHPDDHPWLLDHVQQAGGLVLAEYRVVAQDGAVR
jgi:PAS domain-containing protein